MTEVREGRSTADRPPVLPGRCRPLRLRRTREVRALVRETLLEPSRLIAPLVVVAQPGRREPLEALPGHARLGPDVAAREAQRLASLGIGGVLLFGIPEAKDVTGNAGADPDGPVPTTIRAIRSLDVPLVIAADVCLCQYTTHGHCGVLDADRVDNDRTLPRLVDAAVAYADAGADIVAPSAMADGQVGAIRDGLDAGGYADTAILAYAAKHASALYGPFREAAGSAPAFGNRRAYQMDPANGREALRELELDAAEGADFLMVKPALTNLDLLSRARDRFDLPLAAYQVSGEVAMIEAAAERGWVDRRAAAVELVTAIARAGADVIVTYLAGDIAGWLTDGRERAR